jgi:hypothetical protein
MSKKFARGFQHCDLLIASSDDWSHIFANARGRAAIDAIVDVPINWELGGSSEHIGAPPHWRIVCVRLKEFERAGHATRIPKVEVPKGNDDYETNLRWAIGAKLYAETLRAVIFDDHTGFRLVEIEGDKPVTNVINFDRWRGRH